MILKKANGYPCKCPLVKPADPFLITRLPMVMALLMLITIHKLLKEEESSSSMTEDDDIEDGKYLGNDD